MYEDYIRDRMTELRLQKNVSEYKMSRAMGHGSNYIGNITSGRSMLSLPEFLYMCEYFGITPAQFFDESYAYPASVNAIIEDLKTLDEDTLKVVLEITRRFKNQAE